MNDYAIRAEGLSKHYRIGGPRHGYRTLRESLTGAVSAPFKRLLHGPQSVAANETMWALKDVSFEVKQGEVVGIIGRNGAGKSTLLKILSRITTPSEGRVGVRGRVASLLEIGTGFHPELTGRENIFLNGAILGMAKQEILRKFDEIVAFAETEQFLDMPVKRYSSGMSVRLAFAVAAHLESDIVIVDEVLAVGDAEFQKKCLGKMDALSRRGNRAVLFVSHNLEAMMKLCTKGILLDSGRIVISGDAQTVVSSYLKRHRKSAGEVDLGEIGRHSSILGNAHLSKIGRPGAESNWVFEFGQNLLFDVSVECNTPIDDLELGIALSSARGFEIATWTNKCADIRLSAQAGLNVFCVEYDQMLLLPGQYSLGFWIRSSKGLEDHVSEAMEFEVATNVDAAKIDSGGFAGVLVPTAKVSIKTAP